MSKDKALTFHPLCKLVPQMTPIEFEELCKDIHANGVHVPVVVLGTEILEGRHRYMACQTVDRKCPTVEYRGKTDAHSIANFIVSTNCRRRELTAGQKAAMAVELLAWAEQNGGIETQEIPTGWPTPAPSDKNVKNSKRGEGGKPTMAEAAKTAGARTNSAKIAARAKREDREIFEALQAGKISVSEAERAMDAMRDGPPPPKEPDKLPLDSADREIEVPNLVPILSVSGEVIAEFERIRAKLTQIYKEVRALREKPFGRYLGVECEERIKAAGEDLKFSMPYTTCVYCRGACNCKACGHERATTPGPVKGWITKLIFKHAPEALRL